MSNYPLRNFIDLFCGIGGFHQAAKKFDMECVFACDIDKKVREVYFHNYGITPLGDIREIDANDIPDHDLLCAGFPCQSFSGIGKRTGFNDVRGTLFFEIIRILKVKKPKAILLENVKYLTLIDKGKVIEFIMQTLKDIGYGVEYKILNAMDFGIPQKRERVFIVGFLDKNIKFQWPAERYPMLPLREILEENPQEKYFVSQRILQSRQSKHQAKVSPAIWHENTSGSVNSYEYACTLRATASHNYLLVDGKRRLTPREMLRLQGYPDSFQIICSDTQTKKQAGNSVPIPVVSAVIKMLMDSYSTLI